jgi:tetratricopeptide (TPR) repeat protein
LARGIKAAPLFGEGSVTPVDPTTRFISTDLPYAIVKVKSLLPDTVVTLRLVDPAGGEVSVEVQTPPRKKPWDDFDFALPVYILGTDLEQHTGTWHFQVSFNGQAQSDTPFEWQPATALSLSRIREAVGQSPHNADLHWRYGAALALLGHDREGIQELQDAIHLDPRYALYYITLGRIYEREGRQADAIREFQAALATHGSHYDVVFSNWAQAHLAHLHTP